MSNHPFVGGLPHFVSDSPYMLTDYAKTCLGDIFQAIASNIERYFRYTAFSAAFSWSHFCPFIVMPT